VSYPPDVGEIHVGTSGWQYPSGAGTWNGVFYPARRPRGFDELAYYAERFDTVEVNSTFYRIPEAPMSAAWVRRTPAGFTFSIKLFQKFTHPDMYLARGARDWDITREDFDLFRAGIEPVAAAGRLAAVLVQFPASFHADPDTEGYLEWLLAGLAHYPVAVELRHKSWSDRAAGTRELLAATRASWVMIDEPKFSGSIEQSIDSDARGLSPGSPSPLAYFRFHGRNAAEWWDHAHRDDRYNYLYSAAELAPFAGAARELSRRERKVLMYFNNHFSAKAVANASVLKHELGQITPAHFTSAMLQAYPELEGIVEAERTLLGNDTKNQ
jgi:uncharacterized protein YecE (DUF72 family)